MSLIRKYLFSIIIILISFIIILRLFYNNYQNNVCYEKCSDFHLNGDSEHWYYMDYVINNNDTIWIDKQCYNEWCACIDECRIGLCCELLKE